LTTENKENDEHYVNVTSESHLSHQYLLPDRSRQQHGHFPEDSSNERNIPGLNSNQAPNTLKTEKLGAMHRTSTVVSGQHTHAHQSVNSYNTAEFTKFSINQCDILSNQLSRADQGRAERSEIVLTQGSEEKNAVVMAMQKLEVRTIKLEEGLKSAIEIILNLGR